MRLFVALSGVLLLSACEQTPPESQAAPVTEVSSRTGCGGAALPISQVQGRSLASPLLGQRVAIQAIVTARAPALGGVFVQEEQGDRDGDPLTSEGLFLLTDPTPLEVGQLIRTEGVVIEHIDGESSITALTDLGTLLNCGKTELPLPFVIEQAPLVIDDWEALEGMRVSVEPTATVLAPDRLMREAELLVSLSGRQFASTEVALPGETARKVSADNQRSRLLLDTRHRDASELVQQLGLPTQRAPWRVGSEVSEIAGIFSQLNGRAVIHLTQQPKVTQAMRPLQPPEVEGDLRIASFNTLNLFNGDGKGGGFPTSRGASTQAEWQRQLDKHISVLSALHADVVALMELENDADGAESAEAQLLKALNRALGKGGDYVAVVPPSLPLGEDQIRVGMIYRKSRLELKGTAHSQTEAPFDSFHRPPLLQTFVDRRSSQEFTVVANHLKSKGGCDKADAGNRDREDGQGCYNAARVEAARGLAQWVRDQVGDPEQSAIVLLGDFNAYAEEDPIRLLAEQGFTRLRVAGADYSFVYDGLSGSLDHALASVRLRQLLGSAASWHINADESEAFDYQMDDPARTALKRLYRSDPFRSSDHDPLLLGLNLAKAATARKEKRDAKGDAQPSR